MRQENEAPVKARRVTRAHVVQSLIAGAYIFLVFLAMHTVQSHLAVASLGASTFIAFSFPQAQSSRPRFLIGGYCVGAVSGVVFGFFTRWLESVTPPEVPAYIFGCALGVCAAMFLMTILNFEHPPSAALTVAVAMSERPVLLGIAALGCICVLCALKQLLRKWLVNL